MRPRSIRARLALVNGFLFILLVSGLSLLLYFSYSHFLQSDLDRLLERHAALIVKNLAQEMEEDARERPAAPASGAAVGSDGGRELSMLTEFTPGESLAQLIDRRGGVLDASPDVSPTAALVDPAIVRRVLETGQPLFTTIQDDHRGASRLYLRSVSWEGKDPTAVLLVGEPLVRIHETVSRLRRQLLAGAPLMVLLAMAAGYLVAVWNLRPVGRMIQVVRSIGGEDLDRRLETDDPADELGELASTFNDFLDRLQQAFESEQRFVADASHELRTPLSIIRGEIEVTLKRRRTPDEYETALRVVHGEVLRLNRLADSLLLLARAQTEQTSLPMTPVDFGGLISKVCAKLDGAARAKSIRLECSCEEGKVTLSGDSESLEQMIYNLVENAIFYSHEGGLVTVRTGSTEGRIQLAVDDQGV
ncbi:MAG: histidine kinase dimerization/phospho-acceptor domain-containing protein, partial [Acidobacteriota bacterium]